MNWLDKHYYHKAARVMPVITATLVMIIVGSLGYLGHRTLSKLETIQNAGSRYFCESLFWASQPKQAAKT